MGLEGIAMPILQSMAGAAGGAPGGMPGGMPGAGGMPDFGAAGGAGAPPADDPASGLGTVVQGNHKYYRLSATNEEDRNEWIRCIQESIRDNPFHKIISDKKAAIRRKSGQRFQPKVINEKVT